MVGGSLRLGKLNALIAKVSRLRLPSASAALLSIQTAMIFCATPEALASTGSKVPEQTVNLAIANSDARLWPAAKQRAIVIAVHGTTQQSGCFSTLAGQLNDAGYSLIGMDLRGHGRWYYTDDKQSKSKLNYRESAHDLEKLAQSVRRAYPDIPLYCIGESVGAGVVTLAASFDHRLFDGIILASPGTSPNFFNPYMVVRDFLKGIVNLDRQLDVSWYIVHYSSEDPRITHEMVTDSLSRTTLTGREILKTAAFIRSTPQSARGLTPDTSVLLLQGADDHIVRGSTLKAIMHNLPTTNKKMVVIPNCGHLLLGTAYLKQPVVSALINWLDTESSSHRAITAIKAQAGDSKPLGKDVQSHSGVVSSF